MTEPTAVRLAVIGPKYADGRPMGSRCSPGCRQPKVNGGEAHCRACHQTFGAVGFFDAHRIDGWCVDPKSLSLTVVSALWATPAGHVHRQALAERAATARHSRS